MIFMGTQWIPYNKTEEWSKIFLMVSANPLPSCIKKWQTFSCNDGEKGIKGYNLIFTEKGKVDEAVTEITKVISPFWEIEGYGWRLEPLMGVSDSMKVLGKGK
jgi:hypothetical protein